ncbi:hypothetical protein CTAYLR_006500 [Chrysophaeum taylorii]|uniref:PARP-type domain-containing protein n=1 Tax=Chrysophaeum taylorii TaxID=2483200 RepID=A0AAD7UMT6_9STRA|nr:hypothetical protein CTAYLR_006500 [Chrysophaeum taylorii]
MDVPMDIDPPRAAALRDRFVSNREHSKPLPAALPTAPDGPEAAAHLGSGDDDDDPRAALSRHELTPAAKNPPSDEQLLARLTLGRVVVTNQLTVAQQLGFQTSAKDHGHLGGLLAGKVGSNKFVVSTPPWNTGDGGAQAQYAIDSRAKCRHVKCNNYILAHDLRIGKIPPSIKSVEFWRLLDAACRNGHSSRTHWYHVACIFQSFKLVCKGTKTITEVKDIEGFDALRVLDQAQIRYLIDTTTKKPQSTSRRWHEPPPPVSSGVIHPADLKAPPNSHNKKRKASVLNNAADKPPPGNGIGKLEIESVMGLALLGGKKNAKVWRERERGGGGGEQRQRPPPPLPQKQQTSLEPPASALVKPEETPAVPSIPFEARTVS